MPSITPDTNPDIITDLERKSSVKSDLLPKTWTTEDLLEMVGTNGWRNYMAICLALSCKYISINQSFISN